MGPSESMLAPTCRVTAAVMVTGAEGLRSLCSQFKPLSSISVSDVIL